MLRKFLLAGLLIGLLPYTLCAKPKIKALIVDGQNNHAWKTTTPVLKQQLESTGLFQVDVATTPPAHAPMDGFQPKFSDYRVVVLNYVGDNWPAATKTAFVNYVRKGGGVVVYHAANNAFGDWPEFTEIVGLGGWCAWNEKSGPYIRWRDGKAVRLDIPGRAGSHGTRHDYQVIVRDPNHPITRGLPAAWMHATDELYDRLRGPGKNLHVLATAYSDPATRGTGEHELSLYTIAYGKGRIFVTAQGHDPKAMSCVGFLATFQLGAEWAATGKVKQPIPPDFPTADQVRVRQ